VCKTKGEGEQRARIPADELEQHVENRLRLFFATSHDVVDTVGATVASDQRRVTATARQIAETPTDTTAWSIFRPLLEKVAMRADSIDLHIDRRALGRALAWTDREPDASVMPCVLTIPVRLHRTAHELRLVIPSGSAADESAKRNLSLIRFVARGRRWYRQITSGEMPTIKAIAKAEDVSERYVARVLRGSLLAPDIIERILDGRQPVTMTVQQLLDPSPSDWVDQRRHFGISA
jgi:hypothetical protein